MYTLCLISLLSVLTASGSVSTPPIPPANPELTPTPPNVTIGDTVTIRCLSRSGPLPVTYTLFHNMSFRGAETTSGRKRGATFTITISDLSSLGPYKCKANSLTSATYSNEFTFTLLAGNASLTEQGTIYKNSSHMNMSTKQTDCNEIPELTAEGDRVRIGDTVAMHCSLGNGSFPINYILFHNQTTKGKLTESMDRNVSFNVTIVDHTHLGPYKCRANCSTYFVYSKAVNFALQEQTDEGGKLLLWLIVLLILLVIIVVILSWGIIRHQGGRRCYSTKQQATVQPQCIYETVQAKEMEKMQSEEEDVQYCSVVLKEENREKMQDEAEDVEYCSVVLKEGKREKMQSEEDDVQYCSVVLKEGNGVIHGQKETVEYADLPRTQVTQQS
ncbi:allergin-1-like isoform X2 [Hyperolius riggenbachi]|uniref:allergin-1-like isoform X2 n=1 Tax=Hyperolius riggenbachi TaxID=752182 RepID=UPI0035A2B2B6